MKDVMLTTGPGFEGYDIVEYLGFINGQIALGSNFFRDLGSNLAAMTEQESKAFTSKLEHTSENAVQNLSRIAEQRGANAIIGVSLNYAEFSSNSIGTVASGTAVIIKKSEQKEKEVTSSFSVTNYYNMVMPRPVKVTLKGEKGSVKVAAMFYNYIQDEINAVRCDIEFTNYYDEKFLLQGIDFVFEKNNITKLQSEFVDCKIPMKDVHLFKDVKMYIKKYVNPKGVYVPDEAPIDILLTMKQLDSLKNKRGLDAVERYKSDGSTWICNCGYINAAGDAECSVCARKEEELKSTLSFNYEEMHAKMKQKNTVLEMKDVLMEYIKEINAQYRMELLEIMESGLQYEKTRGNMKDTVLEKVEKVFED